MTELDHTHDSRAASWVEGSANHDEFPVQNLPLGVFSLPGTGTRIGTAIGDHVLDLTALAEAGHLPEALTPALTQRTLGEFFALSAKSRLDLRHAVFAQLTSQLWRARLQPHLHRSERCALHLPFEIGDYTDFYVGIHHAMNVGRQFRPENPLLPNYKHVPIGYHGRASSVRPSGVPVIRPKGQRKLSDNDLPVFGPTERLDYELEIGVWIGLGNGLGEPIPIGQAPDHIAGFCLLNDWSARDFQAWEYQPLGPFLAKNFHSSVSPWVVTTEAMAPFRAPQPPRPEGDPEPLTYLRDEADRAKGALAVDLEVHLLTAGMREAGLPPYRLSHGPASNMYWTVAQMITHHGSNGCNLRTGDLLGTGTISAPTDDGLGSLVEISRGGSETISLPTGETRSFLADGDEVLLSATARAEGFASIGFGICRAMILPAR